MARKTFYMVELSEKEREYLVSLIKKGKDYARKINHARVLLLCDEVDNNMDNNEKKKTKTNKDIAKTVGISRKTVSEIRKRFVLEGLESAINDKSRSGRPSEFKGKKEAYIIALACSTPPQGRARWTFRLLADKAVEMDFVDSISHKTVRQILKKTKLSLI